MLWHRADCASALEKFAAVQMIDVRLPTTDGRGLLSPVTPSRSPNSGS